MKKYRSVLISVLAVIAVTALIAAGSLWRMDRWVQDWLFQQRGVPSDEIVLIGIDEETLAELGPYGPSYRAVIAYALEALAADPEKQPAVAAIDVLYEGESGTSADEKLVQAAAKLKNVVTASLAEFGEIITWENGHAVSRNTAAVVNYVEPYRALRDVTVQGHINAMSDKDGILRHALLWVTKPDGEQVYSMAAQTAKIYQESKGNAIRLPSVSPGGHYYIPFTGNPGDFNDGYSVYKLITGQIPADAWAGKIVLIGPYATSLSDDYFTAADKGTKMFGMEYQANVIQSLLKGTFKKDVSDTVQLVILFVIFLASAWVFFRRDLRTGGIVCAGLVVLGFGGSYLLYLAGWVTHVLWLPVGAVILYLAALVDRYLKTASERRALALEKEHIATELALATRIQSNTLPKKFPPFPDRHEFDLYASMTPAKQVGGDLYDFFLIDDNHLCLVIGDVSGKGVPAALFMMLSSALIHHVAMHEISPAKILTAVNAEICSRNPEEMFVTVWLGVLELSTGLLTAASAGHEYPALKQADGHFELVKDRHGFVVGGMDGVRYRDYTLQLTPGAKLFVYTDGVPEATNAANEMFGTERMISALQESENESPEVILSSVSRSVGAFVGTAQQFDDLTMLCVAYHGMPERGFYE